MIHAQRGTRREQRSHAPIASGRSLIQSNAGASIDSRCGNQPDIIHAELHPHRVDRVAERWLRMESSRLHGATSERENESAAGAGSRRRRAGWIQVGRSSWSDHCSSSTHQCVPPYQQSDTQRCCGCVQQTARTNNCLTDRAFSLLCWQLVRSLLDKQHTQRVPRRSHVRQQHCIRESTRLCECGVWAAPSH